MNHNHNHHHHNTASDIKVAFFLNLGFALLEVFGGLWTNSLAIMSDALHDLGDSLVLGLSWYLERYARRGMDKKYSYGYRRFSLLGALFSTIVLVVGSVFILSEAVPRLLDPEPANAGGMVLFAVIGIVVNGIAVLRVRHGRTMNARIVAWHLLEDVLGWIAVLVVSITMLITDFYLLDPILAALITLYVLYNVLRNLRKTVELFLQAVPENVDLDQIDEHLQKIDMVDSSHHTHVWSLDGEHHVLTTHVVVDVCATSEDVKRVKQQIQLLVREHDFEHSTVEIEFGDGDCRMAVERAGSVL